MPASHFKSFIAIMSCVGLVGGTFIPNVSHADSWQDAFTEEELDILFGEGAQIPSMIGPHRVIMSQEEAALVEGEAIPIVYVIGAGVTLAGAAAGGIINAWNGDSVGYGAAAGGVSAFFGYITGGSGAIVSAVAAGGGGIGTTILCSACHGSKH